MKKIVTLVAACLFLCCALAGCGHTHTPAESWTADGENHWHACGSCDEKLDLAAHTASEDWSADAENHWHECTVCGEKLESESHTPGEWEADGANHWRTCTVCGETLTSAAHTMNEDGLCEACGMGVWVDEDGSYNLYAYDEQGTLAVDAYYGADGTLISRYRYIYEYGEDGNVKSAKSYVYDPAWLGHAEEMLIDESVFLPCENPEYGEVYQSECTRYAEDGSKTHSEYAENGSLVRYTEYDAEGNVISVERYECEYDAEGGCVYMAIYVNDVKNYEEFSTATPDGQYVFTKQVYYGDDGAAETTMTYEYAYDDAGNMSKQTAFENGVKSWECVYALDEDGCSYLSKEIYYDETGAVTDETHYDAEGNVIE